MHALFLARHVEAALQVPWVVVGERESVRCFVRVYYVWAKSRDEADAFIRMDVSGEGELLNLGAIEAIQIDQAPEDVRGAIGGGGERGVCWKSGRIFFPCES